SRGAKVGLSGEPSEEIIQRTVEPYNTSLALKTENYVLPVSGNHRENPSLVITQEDPLPLTLLAVLYRVA
ncbi:MAG: hypothetical protein IKO35_04120, partial [Elusimicrobiaceae bacterium]|nr:hypothetical protein [Elusimicrobiaceae bacterium]